MRRKQTHAPSLIGPGFALRGPHSLESESSSSLILRVWCCSVRNTIEQYGWFLHLMPIEATNIERATLSNQYYITPNSNCRWDHRPNWCKYVQSSATASLRHLQQSYGNRLMGYIIHSHGSNQFYFQPKALLDPTKITSHRICSEKVPKFLLQ